MFCYAIFERGLEYFERLVCVCVCVCVYVERINILNKLNELLK